MATEKGEVVVAASASTSRVKKRVPRRATR